MRLCDRLPLRDCPPDEPRDERDRLLGRELAEPPLLLSREERERDRLPPELPELLPPELAELLLPELLLPDPLELLLPEPLDCRLRLDWRC